MFSNAVPGVLHLLGLSRSDVSIMLRLVAIPNVLFRFLTHAGLRLDVRGYCTLGYCTAGYCTVATVDFVLYSVHCRLRYCTVATVQLATVH